LRTHLHDATHDHVLDELGIELVPLDQGLEDLGAEVGRVPAGELPVALAARGADGIDDDSGGHGLLLLSSRTRRPRCEQWSGRPLDRSVKTVCPAFGTRRKGTDLTCAAGRERPATRGGPRPRPTQSETRQSM